MTRRTDRIYWRQRGRGARRAYADFRDFADVGGGREPLRAAGETRATPDLDEAAELLAARLKDLKARRKERRLIGQPRHGTLGELSAIHLKLKAESGKFTFRYLSTAENHLERACAFFGSGRELSTIRPTDVRRWMRHLRQRPNGRGGTLNDKTVRSHLDSLGNLYRRAQSEEYVLPGFNPVMALMEKPSGRSTSEARWLEVHDAALLLEACRTHTPPPDKHGLPFLCPLIATFLLTGGRWSEVRGLEIADVSFERGTVTFRPNEYRRLKTRHSHRVVPLWPQLRAILREYLFSRFGSEEGAGLLFPSHRTGRLVQDYRKGLDAAAKRGGWREGEIRAHQLRHTYCAARLQTLEHGAPVSPFTVMREMGHGSLGLIERIYGHLGTVRHRSEVVEYRVEQHPDALSERLAALRAS